MESLSVHGPARCWRTGLVLNGMWGLAKPVFQVKVSNFT
ncbi:hypothetical protein FLM9_995 [Candidatus Synechococcus spongiarum]|uniref:Uncharacterized protein n=1 Tax=Candidatus Synechococcus spongiarum TaxID=431041 RepID=A0A164YXF3_9SYNE|nr:hypothetical protein FLM9_995 [Candidatus Synechococcus spongiarum]